MYKYIGFTKIILRKIVKKGGIPRNYLNKNFIYEEFGFFGYFLQKLKVNVYNLYIFW